MSTYSHASHRLDKTGFRLKWRAKLAPYPAPIQAAGFTLIEMSIVLVIIGLLVGGVLVGNDLIAAAKMRATATQAQQFETAINTFRLKYNCLPGDCKNATTFGFAINGNGNKKIWGDSEDLLAWQQLAAAGLIEGQYDGSWDGDVKPGESYPMAPISDQHGWRFFHLSTAGTGYFSHLPVNKQFIYLGRYIGGYYASRLSITPAQAYGIDAKIDDGKALTGRIIDWSHPTCQTAGEYRVTVNIDVCNPQYNLGF